METGCLRKRQNGIHLVRVLTLALVIFGMINGLSLTPRSVAASDTGTVYVHIHGCSEEAVSVTNFETLMDTCGGTPYYNNVYIISEGVTTKLHQDESNLNWNLDGVPAHNFGIKVMSEPYYSEPTVYCQDGDDAKPKLMEASFLNSYGYVHATMVGGYVTCEWFAKTGSDAATSSISIDAHDCAPGTDVAASMNDLYSACPEAENGVTIILTSPSGPIGQTTGDNQTGNVYWQFLSPGAYQIAGEPTQGYLPPRIFCDSNADQQSYKDYSTGDWGFNYDLAQDEKLTCDWYTVPEAGATVYISNHLCPGGPYLQDADIYTLAQTCQLSMNGVSFELNSPSDSRSNITGDSASSAIKWFDVAPTSTTIRELQIPGFYAPRVFCSSTLIEDADSGKTEEVAVTDGAINLVVEPGSYLSCEWFNLPDGGEAQAGTVMVYPMACPEGFDPGNSSLQESTDACVTPQDLTDFQLVTQNSIFQLKSGWWESGVVIFYGIGSNQDLTLTATPRDGFQTGAVYCGQSLSSDGQTNGFDRMPTTDTNTIFPTVVPGAQEICHWFMTPTTTGQSQINGDSNAQGDNGEGDSGNGNGQENGSDELLWTGRVEITNRVCPSGLDPLSQDLWENCWEDANGFQFGIYSADQWWPQTSGDWADQMVIWDPVPVQDVIIQGSIPGGFSTPIVYCDGYQMDVSGDGSINLSVNDGQVISCTWFNVQE